MNKTAQEILSDPNFEALTDDEVLNIMANVMYRNKKTSNVLYLVKNAKGELIVLDGYCCIKDKDGVPAATERKTAMQGFLDEAREGVHGVLVLATSPKFGDFLRLIGKGRVADRIQEAVQEVGNRLDRDAINDVLAFIGSQAAYEARDVIKEMLADGVITEDEWKKLVSLT